MEHIGIDLGSKESQVCVRNADGAIVSERRCRTDRLIDFLQGRAPARVIVETCTEALRVTALAQRAGHDVRVVGYAGAIVGRWTSGPGLIRSCGWIDYAA